MKVLISLLLWSWTFIQVFANTALDKAWANYIEETEANAPHGLQTSCIPLRFKAHGDARGTAVLLHGYSACPQQYGDLAPLLAERGFDVLVPLVPGMGNNFNQSAALPPRWKCPLNDCSGPLDDVSQLPVSPQGYVNFAARINAIALLGTAPRVVAGISVGGSLASYAGQDSIDGEPLYVRQLIMNPMLKARDKKASIIMRALNALPFSKELWLGWGEGCRDERNAGRAGICTFMVDNAVAAADFGQFNTLGQLRVPSSSSVAILYDQGDPVVSTSAIRELVQKYKQQQQLMKSGDTLSCVLNFTLHSMLSKWDDVGTNRWWTNELFCDIVAWLAEGQAFQVDSATNSTEGGEHYCHLKCSATACPYNISTPLECPYLPPAV